MAVTTPAPASMEVLTMAKSTGRAIRGVPLNWLNATLAKLQANPRDDCVRWPYAKSGQGHGIVVIDGRTRTVSTIVLERAVGPRPTGMEACHQPIVCHNASCVNPAHLRWDTASNNQLDRLLDGTGSTTLTLRDAWEIRQLHATGEWTPRQLAMEFDVSLVAIQGILKGRTWRHIEGVPRPSAMDHPARFT